MHNKFVMIDHNTVFTGSANFTKPAFDCNSKSFNFENVLILHSNDIATKFLKEFVTIEETIFNLYIEIVAKYESLPQWMYRLRSILFKQKSRLPSILYKNIQNYNEIEQGRLLNFFRVNQ